MLAQVISGIPLDGSPPAQQPILTRGRTLPPSAPVLLHHVEEAEEEEAAAAAADADIEPEIQVEDIQAEAVQAEAVEAEAP